MKTPIKTVIEWVTNNAFNIEGQCGTKYVVIDAEEMQKEFDKWLEMEKPKKQWKETIICPECKTVQMAIVEATPIFNSYVHECVKCEHIITESEWQTVKEEK
jgi:hypothetical protein